MEKRKSRVFYATKEDVHSHITSSGYFTAGCSFYQDSRRGRPRIEILIFDFWMILLSLDLGWKSAPNTAPSSLGGSASAGL